jgi:PTS system fructose-specific IIC component
MKFVAVTSCPTGIAHTYMAAEALEQAAGAAGHEVVVETQGSAGSTPLDPAVIAAADGVILAADLEVRDKERFAGKPTVDVGVKAAVHDAPGVLAGAVAAVEAAPGGAAGPAAAPVVAPSRQKSGAGTRIRQYLMTGVSYMIPFVAAGGILIAAGFMLATIAWPANGAVEVTAVVDGFNATAFTGWIADFSYGSLQDWSVLLFWIGKWAFGFLVLALSAYIAYAIADRPGLVPGFVGGFAANFVGAGFLGGIVTGFLAGFLALWVSRWNVPKGARGVMPVVVIPLISTMVVGIATVLVIGPPMKALNDGLMTWLNGLGTVYLIPLGILLGLMQCTDLGGPINKVAYVFAVTGLANATSASSTEARIMAAVMAAGMVPPLAVALATVLRPKLFSEAERESGKSCWLLGASFISEGAIPFAAEDPVRMIPSFMVGGAVSGGLIMALGSGQLAPHGGIWVLPLIGNPFMFLIALVAGVVVSALLVITAKGIGRNPHEVELEAAESVQALSGSRA